MWAVGGAQSHKDFCVGVTFGRVGTEINMDGDDDGGARMVSGAFTSASLSAKVFLKNNHNFNVYLYKLLLLL